MKRLFLKLFILPMLILLPACSSQAGQTTTIIVFPALTSTTAPVAPSPIPSTLIPSSPSLASPTPGEAPADSASTTIPNTGATATPRGSGASALPNPDSYTWRQVATGLDAPIGMTNAGDGSKRLFVNEKAGVIRILQNGQVLPDPFLDIRDRVGSRGSEQGLLGLAFDPHYKDNGFFYVNYTDVDGNTHIARFKVTSNPDVADPSSEKLILFVRQPYPNHNGGQLAFGPDGDLYIGLGDGGSEGDPHNIGQNLQTHLGKLLRIDVDHADPYAIPGDNPFVSGKGLKEIWAYGLRNPWRFSFDLQTHDLYIGDVGQDNWEEVDFIPAGSPGGMNFGWSYREGMHPYKGTPPSGLKLIDPVAEYDHSFGCAITGGYVYRGVNLPAWQGVYLYGDYCSGNVWGLRRASDGTWQNQLLFSTGYSISSFGQDEAGEIYLVDMKGDIYILDKK